MGEGGQRHDPAALPRERPGASCIGGWVGPQGRSGEELCEITQKQNNAEFIFQNLIVEKMFQFLQHVSALFTAIIRYYV